MTAQTEWRIPKLPREEWTDEAREVFAFWGEPNSWEEGSKTNIIMVMANNPKLGMAFSTFGKHFLMTSTIPLRERELITMRVAWLVKSEYEWHNHVGYCLNLGMGLDEIAAIKDGADGAWPWSDADRALLRGCDELLATNDLTDATWQTLSGFFDKQQMMDYVFTIGQYVMTSWALSAFRMPLEAHADKIGWDLVTASGKIPQKTMKPGESDDWADKRGYSE
jgi:4-carboxymuconolactone decarboxylase